MTRSFWWILMPVLLDPHIQFNRRQPNDHAAKRNRMFLSLLEEL